MKSPAGNHYGSSKVNVSESYTGFVSGKECHNNNYLLCAYNVLITSLNFSSAFFLRADTPLMESTFSLLFKVLTQASEVLWQECWYTLVCCLSY